MNTIYPVVVLMVLTAVTLTATGPGTTGRVDVAVTFYPLQTMTTALLEGTGLHAVSIIPPGAAPHSFSPSPSDLQAVRDARVYVAAGAGLAGWEDALLGDMHPVKRLIQAEEDIRLRRVQDGDRDHQTGNLSVDPHYWVSPDNALTMTRTIYQGLAQAYPDRNRTLWQNYQAYREQLRSLDQAYETGLADCRTETLVTTHAAYSYLAADYGFRQAAIMGLGPVSEPAPRQVQRLIRLAEREDITHIAYQEGTDPHIAATIADQTGAETVPLDPVLGGSGTGYVATMYTNLEHLRTAMGCR